MSIRIHPRLPKGPEPDLVGFCDTSKPIPASKRAAIDALANCDSAADVYGAVERPRRHEAFTSSGWKQSRARPCAHTIINRGQCRDDYCSESLHVDHTTVWHLGTHYMVTTEPYGIDAKRLKELIAVCERNDLRMWVDAGTAIHFPGQTVQIQFSKQDD